VCCLVLLLVAGTTPAAGQEWTWKPVKLGAGGYISGIDIHADGTRVIRTDTYGGYKWNTATSEWDHLVTTESMPSADWDQDSSGFTYSDRGVYEIKIAPTDSNIIYMAFDGKLFKTTNGGTSWTRTNFPVQTSGHDANDDQRSYAGKMAIDPNDADVVYVGTDSPTYRLQYTDDGGTTWHTAPTVPDGTASPGISGICFLDSNTIYAASRGNGVYETTDGGTTWAEITNGGDPTNVVDGECYKGSYYVTSPGRDTSSVWKWNGTTWSDLAPNPAQPRGHSIAGDPNADAVCTGSGTPWACCTGVGTVPCRRLALLNGFGGVQVSRDDGATWDPLKWTPEKVAPNIPWQAVGSSSYMASSDMMFDPNGATGQLYYAAGAGVWKSTLPTGALGTDIEWTETSVGIEQLVINDIAAPPNESYVHVCAYDFGTFSFTSSGVDSYLSNHGTTNEQQNCMGLAYAATDTTNPLLVAVTGRSPGGAIQRSATSDDRGATWDDMTDFVSFTDLAGGVTASTATNFVGYSAVNKGAYYTKDGGSTWTDITDFGDQIHFRVWLNRKIIAADHVTPGKMWLYYVDATDCNDPDTGLWRTTDSGDNWTKLTMNTGDYILSCGYDAWNGHLKTAPGQEDHLWWSPGGASGGHPSTGATLMRSTDGGETWTKPNANLAEVNSFGFGSTFGSYPRIYIAGWVNTGAWTRGIWYSDDAAVTWTQIGTYPLGNFDKITSVDGAKDGTERVYVGYRGSGAAYGEPAAEGGASPPRAPILLP
jgi:photosystem II stability/assembly factor-like uncharacterized protein